jgi:hypothetical protein
MATTEKEVPVDVPTEKENLAVVESVSDSDKGPHTPTDPDEALKHRLRINVDGRENADEEFKVSL